MKKAGGSSSVRGTTSTSPSRSESPTKKAAQSMKINPTGSTKTPMVGRSARSSKSPDSRPNSKAGPTRGLSEEEQKKLLEAERIKAHEAWVKQNCTQFHFIFLDKTEKDMIIDAKMISYMELQRGIARLTPKSNSIFSIYDDQFRPIKNAEPFKLRQKYIVREVYSRTMIPNMTPQVDAKWDFTTYHARPLRWVDKGEIRRQALLAKKAEELRMSGLSADNDGGAAEKMVNRSDNRSDSAWEAAVAQAEGSKSTKRP